MSSSGSGSMSPVPGGGGSSSIGLGYAQPLPRTLLPLVRYAEIMRIPIPHFQQLNGNKAPVVSGCGDDAIWDQNDRDTLAWAIVQAEELIAEYLNFWPAPKFITGEEIAFGLTGVKNGWRHDWMNAEVAPRWGKVQCFGTEQLTVKLENASVTYQDLDSDPLSREETATVEVSSVSACDAACEVAVFFRTEDGAEDSADPRWEIRPIKVDIDGTTMTIKAEASLFVKPTLWSLTKRDSVGSTDTEAWKINYDTDNFVSLVDVYCRTVDQSIPITLNWDGACNCTGICQHRTQAACAYITDNRRGYFAPRPATWNGTTNIFTSPTYAFPPESVTANYYAGYPLDTRSCRMNANMERAIVKLANILLPEPPCGYCGVAKTIWDKDRKEIDPGLVGGFTPPWSLFVQGGFEAWKLINIFAHGVGGKMGLSYR